MTKFKVWEYQPCWHGPHKGTLTNGPEIIVEADDGPSAIRKALNVQFLPGYAHDGNHMNIHIQFDGYGTHGAHARVIEDDDK